ncbi:MAG: calcium-binding protein [Methyloceanibacter sp.]|uniref:calcium-binding protein n=1 Tax=Methyloceanibacter sp. TaxID=1965321 RepID=UPI003D6D2DA0
MAQFNASTTITADDFDSVNPSVEYAADDVALTIAAGVFRGSGFSCVDSNFANSTLINNGTIFSSGFAGVAFDSTNAVITNNASGTISALIGINLESVGATVTNHGRIFGHEDTGVIFSTSSDQVVLTNTGEIFGHVQGILDFSPITGGTIVNSGLIHSDQWGVAIDTDTGLITVITNAAGGIIEGDTAAIFTESRGRLSLDNRGTIDGDINCNAGVGNVNDTVINRGKILGQVFLGDGDDIFNGATGTSGRVFGEDGNDTLIGGKGNDTLDGGAGMDMIRGGRGKDSLFGGTEADIFDFNSIKDSAKGSKRDVINDLLRGTDTIDLEGIDAKTGVSGNQKFTWIAKQDFHDKKGELRYEDKGNKVIVQGDVDGDGKADFEILVKVGALNQNDFLL